MKKTEIIHAGWLIDGTGVPIRENVLLLIEDGCIRAITTTAESDMTQPYTDLSDSTLIPGLVDSHLHLSMSGINNPEIRAKQLRASFEDIREVISHNLNQLVSFGVIAARDGGDHNAHALRYKQECLNSGQHTLCLKIAGKAWHKAGRYGSLIGRPPCEGQSLAEAVLKNSKGTDHIKIVQSGLNSLKEFGKQTQPQFSSDELKSVAEAAKQLNLKIMVHSNGIIPTRIAIEAGCHSIEHGFFMGDDNLKLMADKGIFWVPTACTMKGYAEQLKPGSVEAETARRNSQHQSEQIFRAREFGVSIALGTDAGSLGVHHGAAIIEELKLLIHAGFSLSEAIRCATLNGAKLLGLENTGALVPGMKAVFIAVKGSPSVLPDGLYGHRIKP